MTSPLQCCKAVVTAPSDARQHCDMLATMLHVSHGHRKAKLRTACHNRAVTSAFFFCYSCSTGFGMFLQARYLVERQDGDVYAMVLDDGNEHRKAIIEQLVNTALPESKHPEMVRATF